MIEVHDLTKRFGNRVAVDHVSFEVRPGMVTGFLGPNGAGKSTTMRMLLGLELPDSGDATIAGRRYRDIANPLAVVGAVLDAKTLHPSRSVANHLRWLAKSNGIDASRIPELLNLVGLDKAAKLKGKALSLGMGQRLGIAAALLGDPEVLILDEPVNGLDPEGIQWIRNLLRELASAGKTIFVSSHIMSEVSQMADHVIVIDKGRILADTDIDTFIQTYGQQRAVVKSPDVWKLQKILTAAGASCEQRGEETLLVGRLSPRQVGELAARESIVLWELRQETTGLEQAFMALTGSRREEIDDARD